MPPHLPAQLEFLLMCDRLKAVRRSTFLHDGSRPENSAEHSWHLALMALTLAEYAAPGTKLPRVVELLLTHDLVEIHAGDLHFAASPEAHARQLRAETEAAEQLFALLPEPQRATFHALHAEFEAAQTPEAQFARALDALQPLLLTWAGGGLGCAMREPDLTAARLRALKEPRLRAFPAL
ncbi:HD domain-containing protein [Deinococcus sp. HMF7604]|uniref:HD domain-containing protein n=1 Tax=Deinococcus betulae TaxID=2873312 RepID=UPI001CCB7642|nr:HD domain-containing protein [Deinococcus betulae]MBZ9750939.1 HD domain-containing protein [Deinococcus betulae]